MLVHICKSKQSLVHYAFDLLLWKAGLSVLHQLVNALLHELKNEVQVVVHSDNFFQLDNLLVVQLSQ